MHRYVKINLFVLPLPNNLLITLNSLQFSDAFRQAKKEMGGLNVICNNAGIACPLGEKVQWEKVLSINLVNR